MSKLDWYLGLMLFVHVLSVKLDYYFDSTLFVQVLTLDWYPSLTLYVLRLTAKSG